MTLSPTQISARALARAFFFLAAIALSLPACTEHSRNKAPDPALHSLPRDLNGRPVNLWNDSAPATVLIFVRTDCPISNRFAPDVRHLCEKYTAARFYLVYVDPAESPDAIRQHLADYHYTCQALRDPDHALVRQTHATITPEAAVYDNTHHLTYRGRINDLYAALGQARTQATTHDLDDAIAATLAGKPVANARTQAVGCTIADLER